MDLPEERKEFFWTQVDPNQLSDDELLDMVHVSIPAHFEEAREMLENTMDRHAATSSIMRTVCYQQNIGPFF